MSNLPRGWVNSEIDIFIESMVGGASPKREDYTHEGVLALNKGDIKPGGVLLIKENPKNLPFDYVGMYKDKILSPNDFVVTLRDLSQKAEFLGLIAKYRGKGQAIITQGMYKLNIRDGFSGDYLLHFSNSYLYRDIVKDEKVGVTQVHLRNGQFKNIGIPVPPSNEQIRIANKLDSLLAKVEAVRARLDKTPTLLRRFRQSVLAAATNGELTKEWRSLHDSTWERVLLGEVGEGFNYGSSAKSKTEGEIPVLRMGNLQGGNLDWEKLVYTSDEKEIEKYLLEPGDVLFNRTNSPELVGKTSIYRGERKAIYAGYLIRVGGTSRLNSEYLNIQMNSPHARDYCWSVKTDGVSQSNINAKKLREYEFELPSIDEQKEIVRKVATLFNLADLAEGKYLYAKKLVGGLGQSILAKAYRGELVPQDPKDESAEFLLKTILAERVTAKSIPKKKIKKASSKNQLKIDISDKPKYQFNLWLSGDDRDHAEKIMSLLSKQDRFSVEQLRNIIGFDGDDESFQQLLLRLMKGKVGSFSPLLDLAEWNESTGEYVLKIANGADQLI